MKSKILAALCTVVISAGLLCGCGNNDQTDSTAKSEETTEAAQEETADEKEGEQAGFTDGGSDSSSETTEETTETASGESGTTVLDTSSELTGIHHAEIVVKDYGTIDLELDADKAPVTVTNFVKLTQDKFYDGLTFHRIMDGFMIQGGDPNGNGTGGSDENIKGEFSNNGVKNDISHTRGTISMARASDPDSGSSQFFIVQADSTFLDGDYAGFGHVTEGMDVVDKICKDAKPTDNNGTIPADQQPVIESVRILD
ncbi:MAG: peptidylprolyl isomerase [Blautia sp.]|nr:peptidylprolyl isomerase [Blautia sp.]